MVSFSFAFLLENIADLILLAAPAKCTLASIPNFSTISTRSQLTCSACLAGTYLSAGKCLSSCPSGTVALGSSCVGSSSKFSFSNFANLFSSLRFELWNLLWNYHLLHLMLVIISASSEWCLYRWSFLSGWILFFLRLSVFELDYLHLEHLQ